MKRSNSVILTIFKKDIQSELRSKDAITVMVTFSLLMLVLFSMAFDPGKETISEIVPGLIWMGFIFAGILGFNRTFKRDQVNDCLTGILAAPIEPYQIFCGKALSNLTLLLVMELINFPLYFVFYDIEVKGSIFELILILLLGSIGFVLVGTFIAGLTSSFKASESILPVVLLPLLVPILLAAIESTTAILNGATFKDYQIWLSILGFYDIVFFTLPFILFDYLMEVS